MTPTSDSKDPAKGTMSSFSSATARASGTGSTASPAGRMSASPRKAWPRRIAPAPCSRQTGYRFGSAFTSTLKRAHNTLDIILEEIGQGKIPTAQGRRPQRARLWRAGRHQQGRGAQALGRRPGAYLAALLRHRPARRRVAEGHRAPRRAVLREVDRARAAKGQERDRGRPRQLAALADHGARPAVAR